MNILEEVKNIEEEIINFRRDLHRIPELQLNLPKTMEYIGKVLDENEIPYKKIVEGNGVVAEIKGKNTGGCIAIRADSDALPIEEETGLPFKSENGCMHACGHDGHTAMALGAALILNRNRDKFDGTVKIFFQPGEEYPGGALPMIEEGCMEDPKVERVIGLHNGQLFPIEPGRVGFMPGEMMAAMDRFKITVIGKGTHGATPHLGKDPIPCICEIVNGLQKIVSRMVNPAEKVLLSVCQIHGGFTQNIIPDTVFVEGTVRTFDDEVRRSIAENIKNISENIAKAYGMDAEVEYDFKYPAVINDEEFTEYVVDCAKEVLGEERVEYLKEPSFGGEDMAYFLREAKGTFFALSNPKVHEGGKIYPHHSPKFDLDESKLYMGTAIFVKVAMDYLNGK